MPSTGVVSRTAHRWTRGVDNRYSIWSVHSVGEARKALKYPLDKMGLCGGHSSNPKLPLEDKIDEILQDLGVF